MNMGSFSFVEPRHTSAPPARAPIEWDLVFLPPSINHVTNNQSFCSSNHNYLLFNSCHPNALLLASLDIAVEENTVVGGLGTCFYSQALITSIQGKRALYLLLHEECCFYVN